MPPEIMLFQDTMTLGAGHSIMVSHVGRGLDGSKLSDGVFKAANKDKASLESYGLFSNAINYNTFYPDADAKSFDPNEDEFIQPIFRMLSNCVVAKPYSPTEFPADVLKAGMNMLVGQTVNCDHSTDIGNAIGSVVEVYWQEAYQDGDTFIPAGINAKLKIDAKANPRIARGINMDPPSIHSNSVTIMFEWKPSHEFENKWEFWEKLGTYDKDGQLIRRIATRIIAFKETSLVSHGADPYAQLIKDGKLVNPGYADSIYNSFSEAAQRDAVKSKIDHSRASYIDYKGFSETVINHNTSENIIEGVNLGDSSTSPENLNNHNNSMPELTQFLEQLFGEGMLSLAEGATATTEHALAEISRILSENASLMEAKTSSESQVTSLQEEVTKLKNDLKANEKFAEIGTNYFKEVKESTLASYKKLVGEGKEDTNILTLIESVDSVSTLVSLKSSYDAQLEEKFPLHCADCGSHNVNRGASVSSQENSDKDTDSSVSSVMNKIAQGKL